MAANETRICPHFVSNLSLATKFLLTLSLQPTTVSFMQWAQVILKSKYQMTRRQVKSNFATLCMLWIWAWRLCQSATLSRLGTMQFEDGSCKIKKNSLIISKIPASMNRLLKVEHLLVATESPEHVDILMLHHRLRHISAAADTICQLVHSNAASC